MYTKRGNVKITKIISDLRDAVVDLKKVVLFEYENKRGISYSKRTTFFKSTKHVETCLVNLRVLSFSLKF